MRSTVFGEKEEKPVCLWHREDGGGVKRRLERSRKSERRAARWTLQGQRL